VTRLRKLMLDELQRRNYAQSTVRSYVRAIDEFATYFHRPPDQLGPDHIRQYQAHLFRDRKLAPGTVEQCGAALRFFFVKTLGRPYLPDHIPLPKRQRPLPTYSHIGYNLKMTDMQAAVGLAQLDKLPRFIEARKRNFQRLHDGLKPLSDVLVLPEATPGSEPSWFGFPLAVREGAPFRRDALIEHLDSKRIATRLLFGGNLIRQPAYKDTHYRVAGDLKKTDFVMRNVFWIGLYPGLGSAALDCVVTNFKEFVRSVGL